MTGPRELSAAQRSAVARARRLVTPALPGHAEAAERLGMPGAPPAAVAGGLLSAIVAELVAAAPPELPAAERRAVELARLAVAPGAGPADPAVLGGMLLGAALVLVGIVDELAPPPP